MTTATDQRRKRNGRGTVQHSHMRRAGFSSSLISLHFPVWSFARRQASECYHHCLSEQRLVGLVTDFPLDIKYHLPHTPGWREGVSIVAEFLYRTSRYTSPRPNFPPAATESGMELAPTKSLPFDPRSFWRAGDHLGRFDVTPSIQARQITPKLQGYLAC
jgi:hypothetical protein